MLMLAEIHVPDICFAKESVVNFKMSFRCHRFKQKIKDLF